MILYIFFDIIIIIIIILLSSKIFIPALDGIFFTGVWVSYNKFLSRTLLRDLANLKMW